MKAIHNWRGTGWPKTKVVNDLIYRNNESNSQQEAEQNHTEIVVNDLIYRNNESNSQLLTVKFNHKKSCQSSPMIPFPANVPVVNDP